MKTATLILALTAAPALAQSTISTTHHYAWSANTGWTDWRPSAADGVVIGEYVLSGWVWVANTGWIHLGDGTPDNGIQYSNTTATDYGVNLMPGGLLRGYAWSPNTGWVNFEATGNPRVVLTTGDIYGYAWDANAGWINLDDPTHYVTTPTITPGADTDSDGIADAWEREQGDATLLTLGLGDTDGDGVPDVDEYRADSNPFDPDARLRITDYTPNPTTGLISLSWTSSPRRLYNVEEKDNLEAGSWLTVLGPAPGLIGTTSHSYTSTVTTKKFHRVTARLPLSSP